MPWPPSPAHALLTSTGSPATRVSMPLPPASSFNVAFGLSVWMSPWRMITSPVYTIRSSPLRRSSPWLGPRPARPAWPRPSPRRVHAGDDGPRPPAAACRPPAPGSGSRPPGSRPCPAQQGRLAIVGHLRAWHVYSKRSAARSASRLAAQEPAFRAGPAQHVAHVVVGRRSRSGGDLDGLGGQLAALRGVASAGPPGGKARTRSVEVGLLRRRLLGALANTTSFVNSMTEGSPVLGSTRARKLWQVSVRARRLGRR